ncbi:hypothetical protein [Duganella sp. Root1480D1]|uniref:hypothetical protein n=1 Tax=Duganella sp. Root1480D1 TaxID=1736471 RepID=UPI00070B4F28|nr:hypothetical protein [Duganella sp. Root1480D1]KQZ42463.1 hypothetical protein ASD58_24130 [Duganella sp. Root1480D1]
MSFRFGLLAAVAAALLSGCASAPQAPVSKGFRVFAEPGLRVGVAMSRLPKVDTSFPGADWPLTRVAASVANAALTAHTRTLPADDLASLKGDIAEALKLKGQVPVMIDEPIAADQLPKASATARNAAARDYASLRSKYRLDKLLVVELTEVGITRPYSSYIPTGDPKGIVSGVSYMVNLKDNSYDWYQPVLRQKSAHGNWDEAPAFPGLSNAYFQAIEEARQAILKPLAN